MKAFFNSSNTLVRPVSSFLLSGLIFFAVFYKLGYENLNVDQFLWYARTQKFFSAIEQGRFQDTYQQYHPGVALMYSIGAGQLAYKLITNDSSIFPNISYTKFGLYNFCTKLFLVSLIVLILLFSASILKKIWSSKQHAYLFLTLTFFEMYYIGVIRNLHLDGLVSVLVFVTTIIFYFALKVASRKWVVVSGMFMGLGLLTKSSATFVGIYCLLIALFFLITKNIDFRWLTKSFLIWLSITAIVFVTLFPAMWVDPISTMKKIVVEGVFETGADGGFSHYVNNIRMRDPGPTFYMLVMKYRVTPLVQLMVFGYLIHLIVSFVVVLKEKQFRGTLTKVPSLTAISLICVLVYFIVLTVASKKTDRYFSINYPFLLLISTDMLFILFKRVTGKIRLKILFGLVVLLGFAYNIYNIFTLNSYGMAYYNHTWGGLSKAKKQMYLNQGGIGYFEVARFINAQDLPPDTVIGATSDTPLKYLIKYRVTQPQPEKRKLYKLVVLPLQQDEQFKHGRKAAYTFKIQGQDYWRVYYRDFEPKLLIN